MFGWQHLDLDLDLKSIDLKYLDLKSLDLLAMYVDHSQLEKSVFFEFPA